MWSLAVVVAPGPAGILRAMEPTPTPGPSTCCAVVVTYHPDTGFPERVERIAGQTARVVVVDNGSSPQACEMLARLAQADPRIELVLVAANEGIGAALNRGFEKAIAAGAGWVVTLDQDSAVEPDLVEELSSIWAQHPERDRVGLLGPNYVLGTGELGLIFPDGAGRWKEMQVAITSGAMIPVRAYEEAGPFRSDYFIDCVDEEFCLRLRRLGLRVVCATRCLMRHPLGGSRKHRVLGRDLVTSHHPPFRRYYMMRNRMLTLREFAVREPDWALLRVRMTLQELALVPLLEDQRMAKLRAMLLGLWDGALGRTGKATRSF